MTTIIDPDKVIDFYVKRISRSNWEVINRTDKGIQIKQPKRLNRLGFWAGLILLPFWGIGFIIWLIVLLDYILQHEKITFVTVDRMIEQLKVAK
jgi:hypothetical protein